MKLKTLVKKYASNPVLFDYELFEASTGIGKNDKVATKDALIAFDEAAEDLFNCQVDLGRKKTKKKKVKNNSNTTAWVIGGLAVLGIGAYAWSQRKTTAEKKTELITFARSAEVPNEELVDVLNRMTEAEINSTYEFIFKYFVPNKTLADTSKLYAEINAISTKYGIFT